MSVMMRDERDPLLGSTHPDSRPITATDILRSIEEHSNPRPIGPYQVVRDFEAELCRFTGAPFAVTTSSCTAALLLACRWHLCRERIFKGAIDPLYPKASIQIPRRTYVGVACSIVHAGGRPTFRDEEWSGSYQLKPYPIWDSARWFTEGLFSDHLTANGALRYVCLSFQASKTLGDTQGGALLHNDHAADAWLRRMRFDGRTENVAPKDDTFREVGYHCYLSNDVAARLLLKLHSLPRHNEPLPNSEYPDLSLHEAFQ